MAQKCIEGNVGEKEGDGRSRDRIRDVFQTDQLKSTKYKGVCMKKLMRGKRAKVLAGA